MKKLFLLFLLLPLVGSAATYFVDPVSGNDNGNGTAQNSAWKHLPGTVGFGPGNWQVINNGDTVYVKGGSTNNCQVLFQTTWYNGSAAFDSILIQSGDLVAGWGTGRAIFDAQSTRGYGFDFGMTSFSFPQGITVDGFEIRNIKAMANVDPGGNGSACIGVGGNGTPYSANFITITRCYLHDSPVANGVDSGYGIEMSLAGNMRISRNIIGPGLGKKGIEPSQCTFGVISNNFLYTCGDHTIALTRSTNYDVCNNLIYFISNSIVQPSCAIVQPSCDRCDIWNNIIWKTSSTTVWNTAGTITYNNGVGGGSPGNSNRFCFNTIVNINGSDGHFVCPFRLGDPQTAGNNTGFKAYNNLIILGRTQAGLYCGMLVPSAMLNDDVEYNDFFYNSASDHVLDIYNGSTDSDATVATFNPGAGHTWANNQQLDPKFTGGAFPTGLDANFRPNTPYFSLSASSPAAVNNTSHAIPADPNIGYNHNANKFNIDIAGVTRAAQAMGAYEAPSDPTITVQPQNQSVVAPATATFSVTASGTAPVTYQWFKNSVSIGGATGTSYTTPATVPGDNGSTFYCVVTSAVGNQTSASAVLTVTGGSTGPTITTQPQSQTLLVGQIATFTIAATGTAPLTYQWNLNGANIGGATGTSFTTAALGLPDSGKQYTCGVTNAVGGVLSSVATLTVLTSFVTPPVVFATNTFIGTAHLGLQ